ncbi:hypothetical protein CY35_18G037800 [Sphagnum magellanicum]|nr:hypothetical protein CY35_18G037800 [Sphagnum magellanicum]
MTSGKILAKLINATNIDRLDIPVGWTQESLQKQHFVFVNQFIWNKIRYGDAEIQILKGIGNETNIELWPESAELCKWWARQTSMPCLMQAALAILANKPSSSGLKCDLGSLSDVLARKRSSLRAGLVEINVFLKINKHLILTNPTEVVLLDKKMNLSWENNIPKRPVMALYDGGEKEEKEEEDTHDDNDNSPV